MIRRCLMTMYFAALVVGAALAQEKKTVPPPPKPEDAGPSLEVTMKFIQDKLNEQGTVYFVLTRSNIDGVLFRQGALMFDVVADASNCTLHVRYKVTNQAEVTNGTSYIAEDGKRIGGDDLHSESITTTTNPFKDVDSITVESQQDIYNRILAQRGHPELTAVYTPPVFVLALKGTKKDAFSYHAQYTVGKQAPHQDDFAADRNQFDFRDEETADRVAKAMLHAVELCGGGNKEPF